MASNPATWTRMKINGLVQIEWKTLGKTHVVCHTVYGDLVESVEGLKDKLQSPYLLRPIREIYGDMLEFAEQIHENQENPSQRTSG